MQTELLKGVVHVRAPEDAELLDVATRAAAAHLHLVTDGHRIFLTPIVQPGWRKVAVRVKDAA
jgi:hypothetical protein